MNRRLKDKSKNNAKKSAYFNAKGVKLAQNHELTPAFAAFKLSVHIDKTNADAWNNLGNMYIADRNYSKAIEAFQKAIQLKPAFALAYSNLGSAHQKNGDNKAALKALRNAHQLDPTHVLALSNLGGLLLHLEQFEEAEHLLRRAHQKSPTHNATYLNLADVLEQTGRIDEAMKLLEPYLQEKPIAPRLAHQWASLNKTAKNFEIAQDFFVSANEQIVSLDYLGELSENSLLVGDYHNYQVAQQKIRNLVDSDHQATNLKPFHGMIAQLNQEQQFKIARNYTQLIKSKVEVLPPVELKTSSKKLRIGYLSGDFSNHPVGLLVNDIFKYHDREFFEIVGFPKVTYNHLSNYHLILSTFDEVVNLEHKSALEAAQLIRNKQIDLLIDLSGPFGQDALSILAYQPAPIQAHACGYTGTFGSDLIQYLFTHEDASPRTNEAFFSETLVYMPDALWATRGFIASLPQLNRDSFKLPQDKFIFCCHHQASRIEPSVIAAWIRILKAVPDSILWLHEQAPIWMSRLKALFEASGIDSQRLVFTQSVHHSDEWHHQLADLWLDTFSVSAGTSSLLCFWAGLPMVTLKGPTTHSRTGAICSHAAGLYEQIAETIDDYVNKAIYWATHRDELKIYRQSILDGRINYPVFDPENFIKMLEQGYRKMTEHHLQASKEKFVTINREH